MLLSSCTALLPLLYIVNANQLPLQHSPIEPSTSILLASESAEPLRPIPLDLLQEAVEDEALDVGAANERQRVFLERDGAAVGDDVAHVTQHADLRRASARRSIGRRRTWT